MAAGRDKDWRNFQKKIKEKRVAGKEKKAKGKGAAALPDDTITVQRLSAEVTGKLQKYSRIGARVFVSYEFEEYTIENIKSACMKHFGIPEDGILCCDVLAGEQGRTTTAIEIYNFDFQAMAWSASPVLVDFNMEETAFGAGGFREAFKATSKHKEYSYTTWVVKHYLDKSLEDMRTLGQTPEQQARPGG